MMNVCMLRLCHHSLNIIQGADYRGHGELHIGKLVGLTRSTLMSESNTIQGGVP